MNSSGPKSPYFSIIIPVYNRSGLIGRALKSVLTQTFSDFEVIVVDDASTDESVQVVQGFEDHRLRLIRHEKNRGVGPARNTGVHHAIGEWVIPLDSDDELLPGALLIMHKRAKESGDNIDRLQFMVLGDDGVVSPNPPLKDEIWGYNDYIRWVGNTVERSETLPIVRRRTFDHVRYSDDRTLEGPYHLDFMRRFTARSCPDVFRLYRHDATNQLSIPNFERLLRDAPTQSMGIERMLTTHGQALAKFSPKYYHRLLQASATLHLLAGRRVKGIRYSTAFLTHSPLSPRGWIVLLVGLIGRVPLAMLITGRAVLRAVLPPKKTSRTA